MRDLSRV
jgi:hypothetical protein